MGFLKTAKHYYKTIHTLFVSSVRRLSDFVQISLTEASATQRSMTVFNVPKKQQQISFVKLKMIMSITRLSAQ